MNADVSPAHDSFALVARALAGCWAGWGRGRGIAVGMLGSRCPLVRTVAGITLIVAVVAAAALLRIVLVSLLRARSVLLRVIAVPSHCKLGGQFKHCLGA